MSDLPENQPFPKGVRYGSRSILTEPASANPEVWYTDPILLEVLRKQTPAQRLAIVNEMWLSARQMFYNLERANHPDGSEDDVNRQVARRLSSVTD